MKIKHKLPRQIKPNEQGLNLIANKSFSLTISFKVEKIYKKDRKIGFFGIPGKNFGISYDYEVSKFVFEYWTQKPDGESEFHCHKDYQFNENDLSNGLTITIEYDVKNLKFKLYNNFVLFDAIYLENPLVDEYNTQSLFIGCHNVVAIKESHKCYTEMDLLHFSIFDGVTDIEKVKKFHDEGFIDLSTKLLCHYKLENSDRIEIILDESGNNNDLSIVNDGQLYFDYTKNKLDNVGRGFCLAKWTQVTMHLQNGMTHSCHHPSPHKVSLPEIKSNPTALHNSKTKKKARKEMLEGYRPSECQYCWNIEDKSKSFSDRVFKSAEPWSEPFFEDITKLNWRDNYVPKYVEVSFSNTCNFKCAYCGPLYSSKWVEEINEHGGYKLFSKEYNGLKEIEYNKTIPYKQTEENPYVDAFWEWWPELYHSLDTFRITGGEPLLSKDTWKVLDFLIENETPNKQLKFSINSNLGVDDKLIDKLIDKLEIIINEEKVKECIIYTSCDTFGKQAEFVRYGLNFTKLITNIEKILSRLDKVTVVVMSTFNIFSIFSYKELIEKIYELKIRYYQPNRFWNTSIILDTSYLRYPTFLDFKLISNYIKPDYFVECENFMKDRTTYRSLNFFQPQSVEDVGFSLKEIEKVTRLKEIFIKESQIKIEDKDLSYFNDCKDFTRFIMKYEMRRNVNCLEYFPELDTFIRANRKMD